MQVFLKQLLITSFKEISFRYTTTKAHTIYGLPLEMHRILPAGYFSYAGMGSCFLDNLWLVRHFIAWVLSCDIDTINLYQLFLRREEI